MSLTTDQLVLLRDFFRALEDHPLEPGDKYYEPFLEQDTRSEAEDPIAEIRTRLRWTQSESVHLLTGQRGSGKSTELRRLKAGLEADGCVVFLRDMRNYMNLSTPVEVSDFLIAIMAALSDAIAERYGKSPRDRGFVERFSDWLQSEVDVNEVTLKAGLADVKGSLRDDPRFKERLQKHLHGLVTRIVREAHGFAREAVELVRSETGEANRRVVLLVDSVEQLRGVGAEQAEQVYRSAENLFSGHAESLLIPTLHVIYTIPPYLTPLAPGLGRALGGGMVCSLPSVHVRTPDGADDRDGLDVMRRIVARRSAEWDSVFTESQLDRIAVSCGGDLRDFFRVLRECLVKANNVSRAKLPVEDVVIEHTENHLRREMLPIAHQDRDWLRRIARTKTAELDAIENLPQLARFFDTNLVLNYRNSDDWYDIHPLLVDEIGVGAEPREAATGE